jgi:long-subunit acyl-CoA synthetase (AMP-forming)
MAAPVDFDALRRSTLPGLLLARARLCPDRVAVRAKELGVYQETTWRRFADRVAAGERASVEPRVTEAYLGTAYARKRGAARC